MSASALKWLALLTMAADHLGMMFFPEQTWIRIVGRVSFPLFAFLLAQGFIHTRSRLRYGLRLALFALLSEVPYDLALYGSLVDWRRQSIMTELLLGFLALVFLERVRKRPLCLLGALACGAAAVFVHASYGAYGICLVSAFYLLRKYPGAMAPVLIALTWAFYGLTDYTLVLGGQAFDLLSRNYLQVHAIWGGLAIAFYNGKKGTRCPKWFFYCFYPLHLLLYWAIRERLWERLPAFNQN